MPDNDVKRYYNHDQGIQTLKVSKIITPLTAVVIALFLYQDIYILHFYFTFWYRFIPIMLCIVYFLLTLSLLKRHVHYVIPLYTLLLLSGIIMILGIAYRIFTNPLYPETFLSNVSTGIQTVFIVLFLIASGARRFLPIVYTVPFVLFMVSLSFNKQLTSLELSALSNPIATTLFLSLLAYAFESMNSRKFALRFTVEQNEDELNQYKNTMEKELAFASYLHRLIMPLKPPVPSISVYYHPYHNLGGDFYDFIPLDKKKERIGIFISDVTGHGVSSAFITATLKHYLVVGKKYHENPQKLMYYLNEYLTGNIGQNFVTALYCIIDFNKKELIYSNAAHYAPIIVGKDGCIHELEKTGKPFPLGIIKKRKLIKYSKNFSYSTIQLQQGSKLVLYTDGIIELYNAGNPSNFDTGVFFQLLQQYHLLSSADMLNEIDRHLTSQHGNNYINDDICVIVVDI